MKGRAIVVMREIILVDRLSYNDFFVVKILIRCFS